MSIHPSPVSSHRTFVAAIQAGKATLLALPPAPIGPLRHLNPQKPLAQTPLAGGGGLMGCHNS